MTPDLEILDYSVYGNAIDADSDRLLAAAATAAGCRVAVRPTAPGADVRVEANRVWLRHDLRSRADLAWMIALARDLARQGRRVFPDALALFTACDKWETYHALHHEGVPTPATQLGLCDTVRRWPVLLKARVGWGGQSNRIVRDARAWRELAPPPGEEEILQPFIPHNRTWIVPVAGGTEIVSVEARRDPDHDGDVRLLPLPAGATGLARAAAAAVGLPAGTVDLIEPPEGPVVLEVNAAPRLPYPDLPGVDLAGPMVRAVLDWMNGNRQA